MSAIAVAHFAGTPGSSSSAPRGNAAENGIWHAKSHWTVTVKRNTASVAPDAEESNDYTDTYRFVVIGKDKNGLWHVRAKMDGASGPWADGYNLFYKDSGGAMVLKRASLGAAPPVPAAQATAALGAAFPLTKRYTKTPRNSRVNGTNPGSDSSLPPTAPPKGSGAPGGGKTPPA